MSGSSGNIYSPSGQDLQGANTAYTGLIPQSYNAASSVSQVPGQAAALGTAGVNNPYNSQAQTGANTASQYGTGTVVPQMQQGAAALQGVGQQASGYVPQALQSGFDPQNALYNRNFQQQMDQQNAINSMSGVSNTPYGAGVTGNAAENFNMNWQNNALQRQQTAASTAAQLGGAANAGFTGAANLGAGAVQEQTSASGLPSSVYNQNIMDAFKALAGQDTATSGAQGVTDQAMSQILSYLGYGTNATQARQNESDKTWQGIGQLGGELATAAILAP